MNAAQIAPQATPKCTYRIELYNLFRGGRAVGNGWLIALLEDGRRCGTVARFGADEGAAREALEILNAIP